MRHLKRAIQEQQGTSTFVQQLFLLGKSSEDTREEPLREEENIASSCTIALCVLTISGKMYVYSLLLIIIRSLLCVFLCISQKGASGMLPHLQFRFVSIHFIFIPAFCEHFVLVQFCFYHIIYPVSFQNKVFKLSGEDNTVAT